MCIYMKFSAIFLGRGCLYAVLIMVPPYFTEIKGTTQEQIKTAFNKFVTSTKVNQCTCAVTRTLMLFSLLCVRCVSLCALASLPCVVGWWKEAVGTWREVVFSISERSNKRGKNTCTCICRLKFFIYTMYVHVGYIICVYSYEHVCMYVYVCVLLIGQDCGQKGIS